MICGNKTDLLWEFLLPELEPRKEMPGRNEDTFPRGYTVQKAGHSILQQMEWNETYLPRGRFNNVSTINYI